METSKKITNHINLSPKYLDIVRTLINKFIPNVEVWAYGSRVTFNNEQYSDLDVIAFVRKNQSLDLQNLRDAFDKSDLPFLVDLHNSNNIPEHYHKYITENYYVLQEKN